jgi:type II secretory pathway component HofQ
VTWEQAPIGEVLQAFAAFSGTSIVVGSDVDGFVTADINDQPWDVALASILASQGLRATEDGYGIILVGTLARQGSDDALEPLVTRAYRISYARATEIQTAVSAVLTPRGSVSVLETTNTLIVTDVPRVHRAVPALLR